MTLFFWLALGALDGTTPPRPLADPGADDWRPLTFRRVERATEYSIEHQDGRPVFHARSDCSASALVLPLPDAGLELTPTLRWSWKVDGALDIADEHTRDGDDFAARVYVMYRRPPVGLTPFTRIRRRIAAALYGREPPDHAITYVWGSRVEVGERWRSPYSRSSHMVVLRSGASDDWHEESVDVISDFDRLIGEPGSRAMAVAIMSDSDDSCQQTSAWFADFRLTQ